MNRYYKEGSKLIKFKLNDAGKILVAQLFTKTCDVAFLVTVIWHFVQTYTPQELSFFLMATAVPSLIVFPFTAKIIKKMGILHTIQYTDFLRGVLFLLVGMFIHNPTLLLMCALIIFGNFLSTLFGTAIMLLPKYIEKDENKRQLLNGRLVFCFSIAGVVGPFFAYMLYSYVGMRTLVFIVGGVYLLIALIEFTIPNKAEYYGRDDEELNALPQKQEKYSIFSHYKHIVFLLFVLFSMSFFIVPLEMFLPLYVKSFFHNQMQFLIFFQVAITVGSLLGGGFLSLKLISGSPWIKIAISFTLMGICYLLFAISREAVVSMFFLFGLGLFSTIGNVFVLNYLQTHPKESHLPQIMAFTNLVSSITYPVALLVAGALLLVLTLSMQTTVYAVIALLICFATFLLKPKEKRAALKDS